MENWGSLPHSISDTTLSDLVVLIVPKTAGADYDSGLFNFACVLSCRISQYIQRYPYDHLPAKSKSCASFFLFSLAGNSFLPQHYRDNDLAALYLFVWVRPLQGEVTIG